MSNRNTILSFSRTRAILIGLLVISGTYLIVDHGQHLAPYLPFAFLLGCLFMHLFMHEKHRDNHGSDADHDRHPHNHQLKP